MADAPAAAEDNQEEALRLKTIAEQKYRSSNLKSALKYARRAHRLSPSLAGVSEMFTAFKILRIAAKSQPSAARSSSQLPPLPDWYGVLDLERFSHINSIKKQYKQLALVLHPDKSSLEASGEAFQLINDAFQVLSDKVRRKEYDMKLRISMQAEAEKRDEPLETFWTACSRCRLLHQFERKYIGHDLVCPNCNRSFKAVEVSDGGEGVEEEEDGGRSEIIRGTSGMVGEKSSDSGSKRKIYGVDEVLERGNSKGSELERMNVCGLSRIADDRSKVVDGKFLGMSNSAKAGSREPWKLVEEWGKVRDKRGKADEELTLAQMKLELRGQMKEGATKKVELKEQQSIEKEVVKVNGLLKGGEVVVMAVEDSDFYDFDKDRVERSFKKGQVWAIYDDDDGMPRHYGLIDEVVSVNPFEVKISWLDLQYHGDERLMLWEKMGFHVSCGRFKVARKDTITLVNIFSHVADCERAAREVYWVYPKKGSVWALYNESSLEVEESDSMRRDKRCYDIVVSLTSYTPMYGLSMAYLEKVDGFKSVFKRRDVGLHAIKWLEKDDFRLFSHQIPARKLSGEEVLDHLKDCWELDPASLPADLLTISYEI
ncbi:hypothetical protein Dimus_008209 [Dionaea muscipula]